MSFQDSAVIFFIALLLFGPKKLPELARQIGKLMGEFRRASNDFRMQMEDELRISEQAERQKQIAAIEAAAPASVAELPPTMMASGPEPENTIAEPARDSESSLEASSGTTAPELKFSEETSAPEPPPDRYRHDAEAGTPVTPLPIATSGDLSMMPPATGLPVSRAKSNGQPAVLEAAVFEAFDSVPEAQATAAEEAELSGGTVHHG